MEMRDIKFPEPKKRDPKQRRLTERIRPFATDQRMSGLDLRQEEYITDMPKWRMPRWPFVVVICLMIAAFAAFAYLSLPTLTSIARLRSIFSSSDKLHETSGTSFSKLITLLQSGGSAVGGLRDLSLSGSKLLKMVDSLRSVLPELINGKEADLVPLLKSARAELDRFKAALDDLVRTDPGLKDKLPFVSNYAALDTEISRGKALIDSLITWLEDPAERHVIVSFANTSELRPGGGFMGSYADLVLKDGVVKDITVHDINEVDNTREQKIIPPQPLQAIASRWRTADANWFFDYPTSAKKTLEFMAESSLYATTTLDGLITITPNVVRDILVVTGPVTMEDGVIVSADNFLDLIQKEVQAGQASEAAAPKAILGRLVPVLKVKLGELDAGDQGKLAVAAKKWIDQKDLMIYMRDRSLAASIGAYKADGALYPLPNNFAGDYLAVVDANIGGGKTDRFIKQQVSLDSHLDIDGVFHDAVTVVRQHDGANVEDWWYSLTNWNYLEIFTPDGVTVEGLSGGGRRDIGLRSDYKNGFTSDKDVMNLEKTLVMTDDHKLQVFKEAGRNVFGTWQKLQPGESKPFTISYARVLPIPPRGGETLLFVFESQSGAASSLDVKITAPVGFIWEEADSAVYEYKNDDPPGRIVTQLTLKKL